MKYRVWFHYYRKYNCLSIHFRGTCYRVNDIICQVPIETKWNNQQPHLVMRGWAKDVSIENNVATILG